MKIPTLAFIIGGLVSMGMPGFSGFVAEFPIFMGVWQAYPWIAIVAVISIVLTASYIIRIVSKVFFGEAPAEIADHLHDVTRSEKLALGVLCFFLVGLGVFPAMMVPMFAEGVRQIAPLIGLGGF